MIEAQLWRRKNLRSFHEITKITWSRWWQTRGSYVGQRKLTEWMQAVTNIHPGKGPAVGEVGECARNDSLSLVLHDAYANVFANI